MLASSLFESIRQKNSMLCVGLDVNPDKLPAHLPKTAEGILQFNKEIIKATEPFAISYKVNTAFYEAMGAEGWEILAETEKLLPKSTFNIADAKRGDIGNTGEQYARAFFEKMNWDAITVAPYMGRDSVAPFIGYKGKAAIVLALTSNPGSADFQMLKLSTGESLFSAVAEKIASWGTPDELMFVAGATQAAYFKELRKVAPQHFLLVPGIGAQGGDLAQTYANGANDYCGLIINNSRQIIYASPGEDFAERAAMVAQSVQQEMSYLLAGKS